MFLTRREMFICVVLSLSSFGVVPGDLRGQSGGSGSSSVSTLYKSASSLFDRPVREIVADSVRWSAIWDSSGGHYSPARKLPWVDFGESMLIVAAGSPLGSGDSVRIQGVAYPRGGIRITVTVFMECLPAQVVSFPIHVVVVPKRTGGLQVRELLVRGPDCA